MLEKLLVRLETERKSICEEAKMARAFDRWRYEGVVLDLQEQVQLLQNDLIIEKSKLVVNVAFGKINQKIQMVQVMQAWKKLLNG